MSTINFHSNISPVYVIRDEDIFNNLMFFRQFLMVEFSKKINKKNKKFTLWYDEETGTPEDMIRSYPAERLGVLRGSFSFFNVELELQIYIVIRGGYYSHANLDIEGDYIYLEGEYVENIEKAKNWLIQYPDDYNVENKWKGAYMKYVKYYLENNYNYLYKIMMKIIHSIFSEIAEKYILLGVFSNGEGVYEKVEEN